jgi:hypothetical protein
MLPGGLATRPTTQRFQPFEQGRKAERLMSYTASQIHQMAAALQRAQRVNDPRYLAFITRFAARTGVSFKGAAEVVRRLAGAR